MGWVSSCQAMSASRSPGRGRVTAVARWMSASSRDSSGCQRLRTRNPTPNRTAPTTRVYSAARASRRVRLGAVTGARVPVIRTLYRTTRASTALRGSGVGRVAPVRCWAAMAELHVTSPSNPRLKGVIALRRRRIREEQGLTVVDGFEELSLALDAGVVPQSVLHCPELMLAPSDQGALVERARDLGATTIRLSRPAFERVA